MAVILRASRLPNVIYCCKFDDVSKELPKQRRQARRWEDRQWRLEYDVEEGGLEPEDDFFSWPDRSPVEK